MTTLHLDIGCGSVPRNPYGADLLYGIDFSLIPGTKCNEFYSVNLGYDRLPFNDCSFDSISAYDLLEHIPRIGTLNGISHFPFIFLMNEIYRVLKPSGKFLAIFPYYPKVEVFSDPTHVNYITKYTHIYFTNPTNWAAIYGFTGSFNINKISYLVSHEFTRGDNKSFKSLLSLIFHFLKHGKTHLKWEFYK